MKLRLLLPLTFAVTVVLWSMVTWPLPVRVCDAIPSSALNAHGQPPRAMIAGDHLQLLYRFWLFGDMLKGHSPVGRNVYEFNRNNDASRYLPGAYYLPFSLVYTAGEEWLGRPFGWNLTGWVSLWLTYVFTILILRFYTGNPWAWFVFGALAILFPYRYSALLGGSPTGFAMMWVPLVILGLEWALRRQSTVGGAVAGLGLFLACISDLQLFFFIFLLAVLWGAGLFLLCWHRDRHPFHLTVISAAGTIWPVAVALAGCYAYSRHLSRFIAGSAHMASGRPMREVALYSPTREMLLSLDLAVNDHGVYMGYVWVLLAVAGGLFALYLALTRKAWQPVIVALAWAVALVLLYALAFGPHGPRDGLLFVMARRVLPPLRMIRQSARFLTLAPTLVPGMLWVVTVLLFGRLSRRAGALLLGVFAVAMTFEYARQTQVELCLLDSRQQAYAAIRDDHASLASSPVRAVALPLWPGDTHWSSLYQYHASLYRVRMLNGYAPVVEQDYYLQVFERFRSMNAGVIGDDQLDALLAMDIRYLLFYEDAFPEIVSPFPASHTLNRLTNHARLALLKRDGRVWAFRILEDPLPAAAEPLLDCPVKFPSRFYDVEHHPRNAAGRVQDASAIDGMAVALDDAFPRLYVAKTSLLGDEGVVWLARMRGQGTFRVLAHDEGLNWRSAVQTLDADEWNWVAVPVTGMPAYAVADVYLEWESGAIQLDYLCLTTLRAPLRTTTMVPACFFRAGLSDASDGSVTFQPGRDAKGRVLYGPRLPFEAGRYRCVMHYESPAPDGVLLGTWTLETPAERSLEIRAGESKAILEFNLALSVPVVFAFHFESEHPIRIKAIQMEWMGQEDRRGDSDGDKAWKP